MDKRLVALLIFIAIVQVFLFFKVQTGRLIQVDYQSQINSLEEKIEALDGSVGRLSFKHREAIQIDTELNASLGRLIRVFKAMLDYSEGVQDLKE